MGARVGRIAVGAALVAGMGATTTAIGAPLADAAQPIVVGDCGATVSGQPGQPVSVDLGAVLGTGHGPVLPLGAIPQKASDTLDVASVTKQHKGLVGGLLGGVTGTLTKALHGGCDVVAKTVNQVSAPVQDAAKPVTKAVKPVTGAATQALGGSTDQAPQSPPDEPAPQAPPQGGPPASGPAHQDGPAAPAGRPGSAPTSVPLYGQLGYGAAPASPASLYSTVPQNAPGFGTGYGVPGMAAPPAAQYGAPTQAPAFGKLPGQPGANGPNGSSGDPVRTAGNASALAANGDRSGNDVGVPLLIAVLAVTGVTAGLVRTWVLKKATQ